MAMANNQGPHYNFLKPFMENLGLEESLINALPSSCVKTKEQRGGFDDLVLSEFQKALVAKQNALQKSVTDEAALVADTKASVVSSFSNVQAKSRFRRPPRRGLNLSLVCERRMRSTPRTSPRARRSKMEHSKPSRLSEIRMCRCLS